MQYKIDIISHTLQYVSNTMHGCMIVEQFTTVLNVLQY